MAKLDTFINIKVDGTAAVSELGQVEKAAKGVDDELDDVTDRGRLGGMASGLEAVKGKMQAIAGPAVVGAVVAGVGKAVERTIELGIQADTVATALNVTTEEASRLNAAFGDVGIEGNDLVDIALQIQGALEDNADLTERLGVNMADIGTPVDAIRVGIDNWDFLSATERASLFGEEGVRQISRMVAEGKTFDEILAGVSDIRIISQADARRAREMAASMAEMKGYIEGLTLTVGGSMLEAFENIQYVTDRLPGNLNAAATAAEAFTFALSPALYTIGKVDDAAIKLVETFGGKVGPEAQIVADAVQKAFLPVEEGINDVGTAADDTGEDVKDLGRTIGRAMSGAEAAVNGFKGVLNIDDQIQKVRDNIEETRDGFEYLSAEGQADLRELSGSVLDLADDLGVATVDRTARIELAYQQGDIDALERELTELTRLRDVYVRIRAIGASGGSSLPGLPFPGSSSVTNVTINASRTMGPRQIALLGREWRNVNG